MPSQPHGGRLVQIRQAAIDSDSFDGFSGTSKLRIDAETQKTIWNIGSGVFSPLEGFMGEGDFVNVIDEMRLESDIPWTLPILLTTDHVEVARAGSRLLLTDEADMPIAVMDCEGTYHFDRKEYSRKVFGTEDVAHPGVAKVCGGPETAAAGRLKLVARPDYGPYAESTLNPR